jgi:hypothetical protein
MVLLPLPMATFVAPCAKCVHGKKIQQSRRQESQTCDARAKAWSVEERPFRQESDEQETGDRHRLVGGS